MKVAVASGEVVSSEVVPTSAETERLRFLGRAAIARLHPAAFGYVCRRGTIAAGEDWFAAARILGRCRRAYDLIPDLARVVGARNAAPLVFYHRLFREAPGAAEILDGRAGIPAGASSSAAQAVALVYELADRVAAEDPQLRRASLEQFAWNVEHRLPFRSAALAVHVATYLMDLDPHVADVPGWSSMEGRIRRDLETFLERRAASIHS